MSEQEAKDDAVAEAERMYEKAKRRYEQAETLYDDAMKALELWKEDHKDDAVDPSNPVLLLLENKLEKANNWLNDAERRLKDAIATKKQFFSVPYWSEWYAVAQGLNLEEQVESRLNVPSLFFFTKVYDGLFIRQEFVDVWRIIMTRLASPQPRLYDAVLVLGSPGIGKSVLGILMFLLAIKAKKDVAYHPLDDDMYYFTWNDNISKYDIAKDPVVEHTYECYYDGKAEKGALNSFLFKCVYLFASPRDDNYNQFVKDRCFEVYVNPWSKQECEKFAKLIDCIDSEWLPKFHCVGGKPRLVFSPKTRDGLINKVTSSVPSKIDELQELVELLQRGVFRNKLPHILFSFSRASDAEPDRFCLDYSSSLVAAVVSARYMIGSAHQSRSLLMTPSLDLQAWRGKAFERHVIETLATSTLDIKPLEGVNTDQDAIITLGPFKALSQLIQAPSYIQNELWLHIPVSKTFPAIDGVLVVPADRHIFYVQITVALQHPIKYNPLQKLYYDLTQRNEFRGYTHMLLFIVTDDIYDNFQVQPYTYSDGKQGRKRKNMMELKQYVGKVKQNPNQTSTITFKIGNEDVSITL